MAYATQADLERKYGLDELIQLTDRADPPTDAVDGAIVADALMAAAAEIDAHVGRAYTLPLAAVPAILRELACQMARYHLHTDGLPEKVGRDYEGALAKLERIAAGKMVLDVPGTADDPQAVAGRVRATTSPRVFTGDTLAGFK